MSQALQYKYSNDNFGRFVTDYTKDGEIMYNPLSAGLCVYECLKWFMT